MIDLQISNGPRVVQAFALGRSRSDLEKRAVAVPLPMAVQLWVGQTANRKGKP